MHLKRQWWAVLVAAVLGGLVSVTAVAAGEQFLRQWDGKQWNPITDWIATDQALARPLVEAAAAKYAQEKGITPRVCP